MEQLQTFYRSFISFEFPLVIIFPLLALLLLVGVKVSKRKEWQDNPFSLETSKAVQGFAAVCIILHHLSQELAEKAGALGDFEDLGVLFVGIFFFFSGYGLYTSLKTKENYLKGFLKKRLTTILIPFFICNSLFAASICIEGAKLSPVEALTLLSGWYLLNSHMWYVIEIAILYLAFFAIYRLIKNRTAATVVMGIFVALMITGSLLLKHGDDYSCSYWFMGEWWYNASFLFVVGIIFSKHAEGLRMFARKAYLVLIPVLAALVAVLRIQTGYMLEMYSYWSEIPGEYNGYLDKVRCLGFQLPWIFVFVCLVLLIMMKVRFGNRVLNFLGKISLELYLIHAMFLHGLHGSLAHISSPGVYVVLTILGSIGFATVINGFDRHIIALINGRERASALPGENTGRIHSIDVMRIVMAFLVVAIHIPFPGKAGQVFITYGKTAVPFFFMVCGYFLFRDDSKEMMTRLVKQTKRIAVLFVAANVFYAVFFMLYERITEGSLNGMRACFTGKALIDFLLYNLSPFSEHLWFLGSLLYALLIMLALNKLGVLKHAVFAGPALIAAYVVLSHLGVGEGYQLRNAILVGLAYTMTGMLIRRFEKKILGVKLLVPVLWILLAVCGTTAIFELNGYKQGVAVPFVSCEILTVVIVLLCLRYPNFLAGTSAENLGRDCSLPVYIMHIAVMCALLLFIPENVGFVSTYGALTAFAASAAIATLYNKIKSVIITVNRGKTEVVTT